MLRGICGLLLASLVFGLTAASSASSSSASPRVPNSAYLVADYFARLWVSDQRGHQVRRIPRFVVGAGGVQGIALTRDRGSAYVSVYGRGEHAPHLYSVSLRTGKKVQVAAAYSPSLSPDGKRLAYITAAVSDGLCCEMTALVVRNLPWGTARTIPLPAGGTWFGPPYLVINWSADGSSIAIWDGTVIRIVNVATASAVDSEPSLPGDTGLAPVFLDQNTVVVETNCCNGRQNLMAVDLQSGSRKLFAHISSYIDTVRRLKDGSLLIANGYHDLVRVTPGHVRVLIDHDITAASP